MTQEQIDAFNANQKNRRFHPLTCGGNRTDENHLDGEGILVATPEGLKCPYCDYTQAFGPWEAGIDAQRSQIVELQAQFDAAHPPS